MPGHRSPARPPAGRVGRVAARAEQGREACATRARAVPGPGDQVSRRRGAGKRHTGERASAGGPDPLAGQGSLCDSGREHRAQATRTGGDGQRCLSRDASFAARISCPPAARPVQHRRLRADRLIAAGRRRRRAIVRSLALPGSIRGRRGGAILSFCVCGATPPHARDSESVPNTRGVVQKPAGACLPACGVANILGLRPLLST